MKLRIDFDDELLQGYVRRGGLPFFTIYWASADGCYPEEGWMDFGSVVLGWWLVAAKRLLEGEKEGELAFMDGPFRLRMRSLGDTVFVSAADLDPPWRVTQEMLVQELLAGARRVHSKLGDLGLGDQEALRVGAAQLEIALADHRRREALGVAQKLSVA